MAEKKIRKSGNRRGKHICPVCKEKTHLTLHHILPKYIMKEIDKSNVEYQYFLRGNNS